ncbi:MAG: LON peptidase substrate-binding domain-containing protein, partial [Planctomycetota bacterium]
MSGTASPTQPENPTVLKLPTIPLKDMVVFPNLVVPLMVGRPRSIAAVQKAVEADNVVFLVAQKDADVEDVGSDDLFRIGCQCRVLQTLKLPDGTLKVVGEVFERARVVEFHHEADCLVTHCVPMSSKYEAAEDDEAFAQLLVDKFTTYVDLNPMVPDKITALVTENKDLGRLSDLIAAHMSIRIEDKQEILGCLEVHERSERVGAVLDQELEMLEAQSRIQERLRGRIQKTQREYFLREQMRAIEDELGTGDIDNEKYDELEARVDESGMPEEVAEVARKELDRLRRTPGMTPQSAVMESYVETLVDLPWTVSTEDNLELDHAREILDEDHYGLEEPKRRIIEYLAVRKLTGRPQGQILCLVGPPGVGKTSLARSVARAMGRRFIRKSLGGVRDEAEIRGHRRTYVGALPGRIVQSIIKAGSRNPVFLLDEIDKLSRDYHGDPGSALLEVLDPTENRHFSDHYLEVEFDLSDVFFITTANLESGIPHVLRDRMEIIRLPGYSQQEKLAIARKYIVPDELDNHGLTTRDVSLRASGLKAIVDEYT